MSALPALVSVLTEAQIEREAQPDVPFAMLLETLHVLRFDGPITLHFKGGKPRTFEMDRPISWKLES